MREGHIIGSEEASPLQVVNIVSSYGLAWQSSFGIIVLLYFYSHYLFASGAAHIGAMYTAFLSVAVACGTPGLLAAVALGQVQPHQNDWLNSISFAYLLSNLKPSHHVSFCVDSVHASLTKCRDRGVS